MKLKVKNANNLIGKLKGVMFQKTVIPIYLETRFGIHTFFVRSPICVLILDKGNIVRYKKAVKPWRMFFWNPKYSRVIELPVKFKSPKLKEKVELSFIINSN